MTSTEAFETIYESDKAVAQVHSGPTGSEVVPGQKRSDIFLDILNGNKKSPIGALRLHISKYDLLDAPMTDKTMMLIPRFPKGQEFKVPEGGKPENYKVTDSAQTDRILSAIRKRGMDLGAPAQKGIIYNGDVSDRFIGTALNIPDNSTVDAPLAHDNTEGVDRNSPKTKTFSKAAETLYQGRLIDEESLKIVQAFEQQLDSGLLTASPSDQAKAFGKITETKGAVKH